jgi:hypothetical protein
VAAFETSYPPPGKSAPPAEVIEAFIRRRVHAIFDAGAGGQLPRILHQQMVNPVPETCRLAEKHLRPRRDRIVRALAAMLKQDPESTIAQVSFTSLLGPIVMLNVHGPVCRHLFADQPPAPAQIKALADQFVTYALGGIAALAAEEKP